MRRGHFEALKPVCPVCRGAGRGHSPLVLSRCEHEQGGHVIEGLLQCPQAQCLREYPILDGIPLIVADIRGFIAGSISAIDGREDLGATSESVLADCCGPGSPYVTLREHVSIYAWDHYGDMDPQEQVGNAAPGGVRMLLEAALEAAGELPSGPLLDLGCSVGRTAFELAARNPGALVLGVDLHYAMLRVAARVLREGRVRYARRRVGLVFDRREFDARFDGAERVDFWACDATALPFAAGVFAAAAGLNVLDCVASPRDLLASLASVLSPGAKALLTTPYDWSTAVTPLESWLGGHSQRSPGAGASEPVLRALLTPGAHPAAIDGLELVAERDALTWRVRTHERSTVEYRAHLVVARRTQ